MTTTIVDRFEGEYAVCEESTQGKEPVFRKLPRVLLPKGIREGDCLVQNSAGDWMVDRGQTLARRKSINRRLQDLYSAHPGAGQAPGAATNQRPSINQTREQTKISRRSEPMEEFFVSSQHTVYAMSGDNPPALEVPAGSRLIFETCDCFHGQVVSPNQDVDALDWTRINPATGPVSILGAQPGDALKVTIEAIRLTGNGVMGAIPELGLFGEETLQSVIRILPVEGEFLNFGDGIRIPVRPMVGVIGTAPAQGSVPCGTPGPHGGNMDCTAICPGHSLYLPVHHPGGLLAMGDVHAAMGDGEVLGTGVEIPAQVQVVVELVKGLGLSEPMVETPSHLYVIASAQTMEAASKQAVREMRPLVMARTGLGSQDAGMLMSAVGSLEVCQVVDPLVTLRFGMPREFVAQRPAE